MTTKDIEEKPKQFQTNSLFESTCGVQYKRESIKFFN